MVKINMKNQNFLLYDIFSDNVRKNPEKIAIIFNGNKITYSEIKNNVDKLADWLELNGYKKGDIAIVHLSNQPDFMMCHLAISKLGGVISTMHMPYRKADIKKALKEVKPSIVISEVEYKDIKLIQLFKELFKEIGISPKLIFSTENELSDYPTLKKIYKNSVDYNKTSIKTSVYDSDNMGLFFTSGTDGNPKACMHTYNTLIKNAVQVVNDSNLNSDSVMLSGSPFTHLFGILSFHSSIIAGCTQVIEPYFNPQKFLELIIKYGVTHLYLVPTEISDLLSIIKKTNKIPNTVEEIRTGGMFVTENIVYETQKYIGNIIPHWGMTELGAGIYDLRTYPAIIKSQTIGKPLPDTDVLILNEDGNIASINETGEILYTGYNLFRYYYNNEVKTEESYIEINGKKWFKTGDSGFIDENGYIHFIGRKKEIIDRGGMKINAIELENILSSHEKIRECAVVPLKHERLGEIACLVCTTNDANITLDEIRNFLEEMDVSKYKWPEKLIVLEEMPKTPTGKISKGVLRELASNYKELENK